MIKISKKADYAVLIMANLAMRQLQEEENQLEGDAQGEEGTPPAPLASAQEVASATHLSKALVANLLKCLTKAELLDSVRGVAGGYRLARPMGAINLAQILEAVEGPMRLVECASEATLEDELQCSLSGSCPSRGAMRVVHDRVARLMEEIHLPELLHLEQRTPPNFTDSRSTVRQGGTR